MSDLVLSAALIVRDEERFLEGCLRSIAGFADEVVVVDTGSLDRSREIARDLGARLYDLPWTGDFAAARNHALDLARGSWILYIDADERVTEGERADVDPFFQDPGLAALTVRFRPVTGFTRYREYRLFRNRPELRFSGVIHETHVRALLDLCAAEGLAIAHSAVAIDHLGYDGDLTHKHHRNLPLLRARLETDPTHVYSWGHLGVTLRGLGDEAGAVEAWRQAVEVVRAKRGRSIADSAPYADLARALLRRGEEVDGLLAEGLFLFPDNYTLRWLQAKSWMEAGRYAEALPVFEGLAAIDPEVEGQGVLAHEERIFGVDLFEALGLCCFRLGRFAESAAWYGKAEALAPEPLEFRTKRWLAESRARA